MNPRKWLLGRKGADSPQPPLSLVGNRAVVVVVHVEPTRWGKDAVGREASNLRPTDYEIARA